MNDAQVTKRKNGKILAKNLIVLLVAVSVALTGVWAWAKYRKTADANSFEVTCNAPDGIYVAIVKHGDPEPTADKYTQLLKIDLDGDTLFSDLNMSEVTGDGINGNFYKPTLRQASEKAYVDTTNAGYKATENIDFLSFDLYIRSKGSNTIAISSSSSIAPVNKDNLTWSEGADSSSYNPSTYGNYSRDCIVGAVRFSVVNATNERSLLWIPAPNIKLADECKSVSTTLTEGSTYTHSYYKFNNNNIPQGPVNLSGDAVTANYSEENPYTLGENKNITTLSEQRSDDYYYNHVTCNLWIEGEDEEARLALVDGKYTVNLNLVISNSTTN